MDFEEYYRGLQEEFEHFKSDAGAIIIFGTREMGKMASKLAKRCGREVLCFCDNDPRKQGQDFCGVRVLSPEENQVRHIPVYLCTFNFGGEQSIEKQLRNLGYTQIYRHDMLQWAWQIDVMQRPIAPEHLAQVLYQLRNRTRFLENLDVMSTECCTLRCKDCSLFIPYFEQPKHYRAREIAASIRNLSEAFTGIHNVSIIGGEPLLHPELAELCNAVAEQKNILNITVVTNATVLPKPETLDALKKYTTIVSISDYGALSGAKDELIRALEKRDILYTVFGDEVKWYQNTKIYPKHRTVQENKKIFDQCIWKHRPLLMGERLFLCQVAAVRERFALGEGEAALTKCIEQVQDLMKKNILQVCDCCDIWKNIPVAKAAQSEARMPAASLEKP